MDILHSKFQSLTEKFYVMWNQLHIVMLSHKSDELVRNRLFAHEDPQVSHIDQFHRCSLSIVLRFHSKNMVD